MVVLKPLVNEPMAKVLLVDDEPSLLDLYSTVLSEAGHDVTTANGGQQALDLLANQQFDLVLMDIEMPEMDGLETTQHIRELPNGSDLTVVALTSHQFLHEIRHGLEVGCDGYIVKPLQPDDLLSELALIFNE